MTHKQIIFAQRFASLLWECAGIYELNPTGWLRCRQMACEQYALARRAMGIDG